MKYRYLHTRKCHADAYISTISNMLPSPVVGEHKIAINQVTFCIDSVCCIGPLVPQDTSGPKVIKLIFILLINVKMPTIDGILSFISRMNTTFESAKVRKYYFFSILLSMRN